MCIFKFFDWEIPAIAHLPNLKEKGENAKLSKRHGSVSAIDFLRDGYLPEALLNFLMFTGWNPGTEKEIYSLKEFVKDFSLEKVQKTDLVAFDREKLLWLNGNYIRKTEAGALNYKLRDWAKKFNIELNQSGKEE
jgi:glutamyl/glutaminyl-tRNA synthetase